MSDYQSLRYELRKTLDAFAYLLELHKTQRREMLTLSQALRRISEQLAPISKGK